MLIIILLCIATIYLAYLFRIEKFLGNISSEIPKELEMEETKELEMEETKELEMEETKELLPKYIPKQPMYCDVMPSNVSELDKYILSKSKVVINLKDNNEQPKPSTYLFYEKIMNTPNTTFKPKRIVDDIHYWKCRDDINRPWYQCE